MLRCSIPKIPSTGDRLAPSYYLGVSSSFLLDQSYYLGVSSSFLLDLDPDFENFKAADALNHDKGCHQNPMNAFI
jgi:hypothetical protein